MEVTADEIKKLPDESKIKLKLYFKPVKDKPGYYWLNKRNCQIISEKTLKKSIDDYIKKGIDNDNRN